jgi:anti-sigma B factor antagonist
MSIGIKVIQFPAILDNPVAKQLHKEIEKTVESGANIILLDFQNVEFISRPGLMVLLLILKTVQISDKKLFIRSMSDPVRMLFELTGLDQVFEICTNENELENTILLKNELEFKSSLVAEFDREAGAIAERVFSSRSQAPSLLISHSDPSL